MSAVLKAVNEIVPDCDPKFLKGKIYAVLVGLGLCNGDNIDENLDAVAIDTAVVGEVCQMVADDLFQNGYKSASETPVSFDECSKINTSNEASSDEGVTTAAVAAAPTPAPTADDNDLNNEAVALESESIQCQCCFCDAAFESMVPCCEGHLFCKPCLLEYVNTKIQDGVKRGYLECMEGNCTAPFARSVLADRVPADVLNRLDERIEAAILIEAAIDDLVRCPKCQTQFELPANEQVLACVSCKHSSCRYCHIQWSTEHAGKRCEEVESADATKSRRLLEEKMTEAIVRKCPKCQTPLIKNQGCNKLSCTCGGKMCYICRAPNIGYDHFCNHAREPTQSCSKCKNCLLWEDPTERDNEQVNSLEVEAKFVAEKDRIAKMIEIGQLPETAMTEFLEKKKVDDATRKKALENKPSTSRQPAPGAQPRHAVLPPAAHLAFNVPFHLQMPGLQMQVNQMPNNYQAIMAAANAAANAAMAMAHALPRPAHQNMRPVAMPVPAAHFPAFDPRNNPFVNFPQPAPTAPFPRMPVVAQQQPSRLPQPKIHAPPPPPPPPPAHRPKATSRARNSDPATDFFDAAIGGSVETIRQLVATHGTYVLQNARNFDGESVLQRAVRSGDMAVVKSLIEYGCKIWSNDRKGDSILHTASNLGRREIAEYLIRKGAAVDVLGEFGRTPLHAACAHGHEDVVQLLIDNGADINGVDEHNGATPLHLASYFGYEEIVRILIENGANVNIADNAGNLPVNVALEGGHAHLTELFFGGELQAKEKQTHNDAGKASTSGRKRSDHSSLDDSQAGSSKRHKKKK